MQTLAVVLVLIAFVGAVISIINIIYPIKAIGFVNRKRAALAFVLSFCLFAIGIITAGVSTSDNPQNESLWLVDPLRHCGLRTVPIRSTGTQEEKIRSKISSAPFCSRPRGSGPTSTRIRAEPTKHHFPEHYGRIRQTGSYGLQRAQRDGFSQATRRP